MDDVIELSRLWTVFKKSFVWMVVLGIIGGVAAFAVAKFGITPKYSSEVALLVNRSNEGQTNTQYADQQADVQLISTYKDIIKKPAILNRVADNLTSPTKKLVKEAVAKKTKREWNTSKLEYETVVVRKAKPAEYKLEAAKYKETEIDAETLSDEISIANEQNSQVFTVTVTTPSAKMAKDIANEIGVVFKQQVVKMMNIKNVSILSKAVKNTTPVSPNKKLFALAGAFVGIVIAFGWALVRELTDQAVKSVDFLTSELGLIDLGVVQFIGKVDKNDTKKTSGTNERRTRRSSRRV